MIRLWSAPAVVGVVVAVLTVWMAGAVRVVVADGWGSTVLSTPSLLLLYAAGPAVLCAVPLVVLARAVLGRAGGSLVVRALLGAVGGALVGVVQTGVLLSAWPWEVGDLVDDLIGLPALGGLVGGIAAGLVRRRQEPADAPANRS